MDTQKGHIIGILNEYAHLGKGRSIHTAGQMEWLHCKVDDRSKVVGGAQRIETSDGYVISLSLVWPTYTLSGFLLIMTSNSIHMSSSHHLTLGMPQSWIMTLHPPYPIKMDCCNANEKCLIATTINPIWHSCPEWYKILSSHS